MIITSTFLFAAMAMAQVADGQPIVVDGAPTIRISLAGFDLSRAQDRQRIDGRIRWAARRVCSDRLNPGQIWYERVDCTHSAISGAQKQLAVIVERNGSGRIASAEKVTLDVLGR